jgi:short-subunit dehydrogenase
MEITNETVVALTGASSGIGRALAVELAAHGARLGLIARRPDLLDQVAAEVESAGGTALTLPCDVTDRIAFEQAVARIIETFGHLDVLVNNAGRGHFAYIDDTPEEQIESIFRVNVFSLWYGTAPAIRHMKERKRGLIVNIASIAGKLAFPANAAYVAAKHAVVGFTRALRSELAGTGVEAIVINPAGAFTDWAVATEGGPMLELFDYENRRGRQIAAELGMEPPPAFEPMSAGEVARAIVEAVRQPRAEVFTHPGSEEIANAYEIDQESVERRLLPAWLANLEGRKKLGK